MKVTLVIPHFDPTRGGAERWTWDFAHNLIARGVDVSVLSESFAQDLPRITPIQVALNKRGSARRLEFAHCAHAALEANNHDIVHDMGHGWSCDVFMPHGGTRAGAFRQNLNFSPPPMRRIKRLASSLLPRYRAFKKLETQQYSGTHKTFIALSHMVERDMFLYHHVPESQLRVIYNGVNTERFHPRHRDIEGRAVRTQLNLQNELVFLIVAHNFRLKGVANALRALSGITDSNPQLVVVGKDKPARYLKLSEELGVRSQVHFVGAQDSRPYFAAADIYVHPTFYDPCSLVALEALASGLPVITTVHNGAAELISQGHEGFLLSDPSDVDGMTQFMRRYLDADYRARSSIKARQLAESNSESHNVVAFLSLYESILHGEDLPARPPYAA